ncbi:hypothetical protein KHA80_21015 [Anaerobacillus sp. HL2]|nr:hypothetical protein KHA80_21015 [Anaerobacillus sp. HL2]
MGSCFVDFLIDDSGEIYVIYIGGCDQSNYLLEVDDEAIWNNYIENCIRYLLYLQKEDQGDHHDLV